MRFASAQILAFVQDGLWLRLAAAANAAARQVAADVQALPGVALVGPVEANEVFLEMPAPALDSLREAGVLFARRGQRLARFVCRWDNTATELEGLITTIRAAAAKAAAEPRHT